jgi:hypothetical protein
MICNNFSLFTFSTFFQITEFFYGPGLLGQAVYSQISPFTGGHEVPLKVPNNTIWTSISTNHSIGPYFFDGSVSHTAYPNMLQTWFIRSFSSCVRGVLHPVARRCTGTCAPRSSRISQYHFQWTMER